MNENIVSIQMNGSAEIIYTKQEELPVSYIEHIVVCNGCEKPASKEWSKWSPKGTLCQQCYAFNYRNKEAK